MSESNRTKILFGEEPSWGVAPSTPLTEMRWTSESLGQSTDTTTSPEVRDDAQLTDIIRTGVNASGDIGIVWSYGTFDLFLQAMLRGTWTNPLAVSVTTITAAATDSSFTDSANAAFTGVKVGDFLQFGGFTGPASGNNKIFQVMTQTNGKVTVLGAVADAASGGTVTVKGSVLKNGVTERSFLLEKQFKGVSPNKFISFPKMRIANGSMNISSAAIITGSLAFQGDQAYPASATVGTGTPVLATSTDVMNSVDNVAQIREGGSLVTLEVSGLDWTVENNLRPRKAVGYLGRSSIKYGTFGITGNLKVYFADSALYEKQFAFLPSDLSYFLQDSLGNVYVFYWPQIKFTGDPLPKAGGLDQDLMVEAPFTAYRDPVLGYTMQVSRFPVA